MASSITGQTFVKSDVVAGQKFYAANYIALIDQMQALNDELRIECVSLAGTQTITGAKTFSAIANLLKGSVLSSSDAPTTDPMIANKKYVDDQNALGVAGQYHRTVVNVFNGSVVANNTFEVLDLSGIIGSNTALCFFKVYLSTQAGNGHFYMQPGDYSYIVSNFTTGGADGGSWGTTMLNFSGVNGQGFLVCSASTAGAIKIASDNTGDTIVIDLVGYIK